MDRDTQPTCQRLAFVSRGHGLACQPLLSGLRGDRLIDVPQVELGSKLSGRQNTAKATFQSLMQAEGEGMGFCLEHGGSLKCEPC